MAARLDHLALVFLEIEVEIRKHMVLDRPRLVAQGVELGKPRPRRRALGDKAARHILERPLQLHIAKGTLGILKKGLAGRSHVPAHRLSFQPFRAARNARRIARFSVPSFGACQPGLSNRCSGPALLLADRRRVRHAGEHLGDVAHTDGAALAAQFALDI